jgi:hypothetical protein
LPSELPGDWTLVERDRLRLMMRSLALIGLGM